jgi:type III pantothenate kinase
VRVSACFLYSFAITFLLFSAIRKSTFRKSTLNQQFWLALNIGNSHYHWILFQGEIEQQSWNLPYPLPDTLEVALANYNLALDPARTQCPEAAEQPLWQSLGLSGLPPELQNLSLWLASVVPEQTQRWQPYPHLHPIALTDIPLQQTYPTLGLDRALAVWGAGITYGFPVLVIDGGTALTLTGATESQAFGGGAILPGLRLQRQALSQGTAVLPLLERPVSLPSRWAMNTTEAIQSGILYTLLAGLQEFIADWCQQYPMSSIILTGGDGQYLYEQLVQKQLVQKQLVQKQLVQKQSDEKQSDQRLSAPANRIQSLSQSEFRQAELCQSELCQAELLQFDPELIGRGICWLRKNRSINPDSGSYSS